MRLPDRRIQARVEQFGQAAVTVARHVQDANHRQTEARRQLRQQFEERVNTAGAAGNDQDLGVVPRQYRCDLGSSFHGAALTLRISTAYHCALLRYTRSRRATTSKRDA